MFEEKKCRKAEADAHEHERIRGKGVTPHGADVFHIAHHCGLSRWGCLKKAEGDLPKVFLNMAENAD